MNSNGNSEETSDDNNTGQKIRVQSYNDGKYTGGSSNDAISLTQKKINLLNQYIGELQKIVNDIDNYNNANIVVNFLKKYDDNKYNDIKDDKNLNATSHASEVFSILKEYKKKQIDFDALINEMNQIEFSESSSLLNKQNQITKKIPLTLSQEYTKFINAYVAIKNKINEPDKFFYNIIKNRLDNKENLFSKLIKNESDPRSTDESKTILSLDNNNMSKQIQSNTEFLEQGNNDKNKPTQINNELLEQVETNTKTLTEACEALKDCLNKFTEKLDDTNSTFKELLDKFQEINNEEK